MDGKTTGRLRGLLFMLVVFGLMPGTAAQASNRKISEQEACEIGMEACIYILHDALLPVHDIE